jgi:hypothetical protein
MSESAKGTFRSLRNLNYRLWALGVGAASGFAAALVGVGYLIKSGSLRVKFDAGRLRFTVPTEKANTELTARSPAASPAANGQ